MTTTTMTTTMAVMTTIHGKEGNRNGMMQVTLGRAGSIRSWHLARLKRASGLLVFFYFVLFVSALKNA